MALAAHHQRHSPVLERCLDSRICDLVEALTAFGAPTVASCTGSPEVALGRPYVAFEAIADVHTVINLAFAATEADGDAAREARILGLPTVPVVQRWMASMVAIVRSGHVELVPHLDIPN